MMEYRMDELFDLQMGKTPSRGNIDYWNSLDHKWISIADLSKSSKYICDTKEYISEKAVKESGISQIPANTVVMSFKLSIGKVAITKENMYSNEAIMSFRDKQLIKLLPDYVYYMLLAQDWNDGANKAVKGKTLNKATLSAKRIKIHDYNTQQEIVDVLEKTYSIILKRRQEIACLDSIVKARFVEMFGDIRTQEKYSGIPLRNLCTTMTGGTPSTSKPEYFNGTIPWISTVSLGPNYIGGENAKGYITEEAIQKSATKLIPAGNILFGTRVGVGKSSINVVDMCTNQDIVALVGIEEKKYSKLFIKHVLDQYQPYFNSKKKGATILGITSDDVKDSLIPDVSLELQKDFESFVLQVDKSKFGKLNRANKSLQKHI